MSDGNKIQGYKGGGGSKHTPVETPDNISSTDNFRILDLISEGEIMGLVNGTQSVFFDETPMSDTNAKENFPGATVQTRTGTPNQGVIKGFDSAENTISVNVDLKHGTPWVQAISNTQDTAVGVTIGVPRLERQNPDNGDTNGTIINYTVELATDNGSYKKVVDGFIRGKTTTAAHREHRIDLPDASSGWSLRVTRLTKDSDKQTIQNKTSIVSYTEIIDGDFTYPNCALVGVIGNAKQFNNIPRRAYDMWGRIVRVPSNYDPKTRKYSGTWDGTFHPKWTDNPAWIFYDLITHTRYGLGDLIDEPLIDKYALYTIGKYCDGMVDDGKGGTEPRFTCNVYLQKQENAYKVLNDLSSVFRGISYWMGGSIVAHGDQPRDPVYIFTNANVIDGMFTYTSTARKDRYSVANVSWNDPRNFMHQRVEHVEYSPAVARYGYREKDATAFACTSQGQAHRLGKWLTVASCELTDGVQFSVGLEGLRCTPGDVIEIMDAHRAGKRQGGRISSASNKKISGTYYGVVTLDDTADAVPGDLLTCNMPDGTTLTKEVKSVSDKKVTLTTKYDTLPKAESIWTITKNQLKPQKFQVTSIKENTSTKDITFDIQAVEYNDSIYGVVENDLDFVRPPISALRPRTPITPNGINLSAAYVKHHGAMTVQVTISWNSVVGAGGYDVDYRVNDGPWVNAGRDVLDTNVDFYDARAGSYDVRVRSILYSGDKSKWGRLDNDVLVTGPQPYFEGGTPAGDRIDHDVGTDPIESKPGAQQKADQAKAEANSHTDSSVDALRSSMNDTFDQVNSDVQAAQQSADDASDYAHAQAANLQGQVVTLQGQVDGAVAQVGDIMDPEQWSSDKAYPTGYLVVKDGSLYRSQKSVPKGKPVSNTTYWKKIGDYQSLGDAVSASIARLNEHDITIEEHGDKITAHGKDISLLGTESGDKSAFVLDQSSVKIDGNTTLGQYIQSVHTAQNNLDDRIDTEEQTRETETSANAKKIDSVQSTLNNQIFPLINGGFETADDSTHCIGWSNSMGNPGSLPPETQVSINYTSGTGAHSGNNAFRFGASGAPLSGDTYVNSDRLYTVAPGDVLQFSFWNKVTQNPPSSDAVLRPYFYWFDANGDPVTADDGNTCTYGGMGDDASIKNRPWTRFSYPKITIPDGVSQIGVQFGINGVPSGGLNSVYCYVDDINIDKLSIADQANAQYIDDVETTVEEHAGEIESHGDKITDLRTDVDGAQAAIAHQESVTATLISGNTIINPNGNGGTGPHVCLNGDLAVVNVPSSSRSNTQAETAIEVTGTIGTTATLYYNGASYSPGGEFPEAHEGQVWHASVMASDWGVGNTGTGHVGICYRKADGTYISGDESPDKNLNDIAFEKWEVTGTCPAGTERVCVEVILNMDGDNNRAVFQSPVLQKDGAANSPTYKITAQEVDNIQAKLPPGGDSAASAGALSTLEGTVNQHGDDIEANSKAVSSTKAQLRDAGNLVTKGYFDDGKTGPWDDTNSVIGIEYTSDGSMPGKVLSISRETYIDVDDAFDCKPGEKFDCSCIISTYYVESSRNDRIFMVIRWLDYNGDTISYSFGGLFALDTGGRTKSFIGKAPDGAVKGQVGIAWHKNSGGTKIYVDAISIKRRTEQQNALAQTVSDQQSTVEQHGDDITANANALTSVKAELPVDLTPTNGAFGPYNSSVNSGWVQYKGTLLSKGSLSSSTGYTFYSKDEETQAHYPISVPDSAFRGQSSMVITVSWENASYVGGDAQIVYCSAYNGSTRVYLSDNQTPFISSFQEQTGRGNRPRSQFQFTAQRHHITRINIWVSLKRSVGTYNNGYVSDIRVTCNTPSNASVTNELSAQVNSQGKLLSQATLLLSADNKVSGYRATNDGSYSDLVFDFDRTAFINDDGSFEISGGRQISRSDGYMTVQGKAFGKNNNLISWAGPEIALSECTENNGAMAFTTDGTYHVPTVMVGAITYKNSTTSKSSTASTSVAALSHGSNPREITGSYTASWSTSETKTTHSGIPPDDELIGSVDMVVEKKTSGSYSTMKEVTFNVVKSWILGNKGPRDIYYWNARINTGGTINTTQTTSSDDYTYRARLKNRTVTGYGDPSSAELKIKVVVNP